MKIILVAGARPNFMKVAPLWNQLTEMPDLFDPILVHTGQHYDDLMSEIFFRDLNLPRPHYELNVGYRRSPHSFCGQCDDRFPCFAISQSR